MSQIRAYKEVFASGNWQEALGGTLVNDVDVTNELSLGHDWPLFGAIAGVEFPQTGHFEAAGFPPDASPEVKAAYDTTVEPRDASVLTFKQVVDRIVELEERKATFTAGSGDDSLLDTLRCLGDFVRRSFTPLDDPELTRVVFWFTD